MYLIISIFFMKIYFVQFCEPKKKNTWYRLKVEHVMMNDLPILEWRKFALKLTISKVLFDYW